MLKENNMPSVLGKVILCGFGAFCIGLSTGNFGLAAGIGCLVFAITLIGE